MATAAQALAVLLPEGGYSITENDFSTLVYDEGVTPLTKKQFDNAIAEYDKTIADAESKKALDKANLLAKLGISESEAKLLLS
jgi:hypothetical protein